MKLVTAIIKPFKLDEVREALSAIGVRASPSPRSRASAARRATPSSTAAPSTSSTSCPRSRSRPRSRTTSLDRVIEAIEKAANTGKIGDGKIFVFDLRAGRAHPHRRDRRGSAVRGARHEKARCNAGDRRRSSRPDPSSPRTSRRRPSPTPAAATAAEATAAAAPAAAPAAAAPAAAQAAPAPTPNKGDVAWLLTSTLLVIMMSIPGLALFYGGMVRAEEHAVGADAGVRRVLADRRCCGASTATASRSPRATRSSAASTGCSCRARSTPPTATFAMAATFSKGDADPRAGVRRVPGDVRRDHRAA